MNMNGVVALFLGAFFGVLVSALYLISINNKASKIGIEKEILEIIACNSVFAYEEVSRVYDIFKSFDLLVAGVAYCQRTGIANLEIACIFEKSKHDELITDLVISKIDSIATVAYYGDDPGDNPE
jgi:hypothetical protein